MRTKRLWNVFPALSMSVLLTIFLAITCQNTAHASQWIKVYKDNTNLSSVAGHIQKTTDGGYIIRGWKRNVSIEYDWISKLDMYGNIQWEKTHDTESGIVAISETEDGGYIAGLYNPSGLLKLYPSGNVQWRMVFYGQGYEYLDDVRPTNDGGYIAVLIVDRFSDLHTKTALVKLDGNGNILWQYTFGNSETRIWPNVVKQTIDDGYIVAAYACGRNKPNSSCRSVALKIDANGRMEWQKQYVSDDLNYPYSITQTSDGGYIVAGAILPPGDFRYNAWLLKLDDKGGIQWQKLYDNGGSEQAYSVIQNADDNYMVSGYSESAGHKCDGAWQVQLDSAGGILAQHVYCDGKNRYDIYEVLNTSDRGYIGAGSISYFGVNKQDAFLLKSDEKGNVPGCLLSRQSHAVVTGSNAVVSNPNLVQSKGWLTAVPVPVTLLDTSTTVTDLCYGVTLLSPDGGETIDSGSVYPISWQPHPDAASYSLKYSTNNGLSWLPIASNYASPDTYNWWVPVPQNNKAGCLVKIAGYNAEGTLVGTDISKAPFAIEVVNMTTPDSAGQTWTSGSAMTITWTTSATIRSVAKTELYYAKDAAVAPVVWEPIAVLDGNPGSHAWTVPTVGKIKANCRFKVVLKDKAGNIIGRDVSDTPFTVMP